MGFYGRQGSMAYKEDCTVKSIKCQTPSIKCQTPGTKLYESFAPHQSLPERPNLWVQPLGANNGLMDK